MCAKAANKNLLEMYQERFGAVVAPIEGHPYGLLIDEISATKLINLYNFDWRDDI